MIDSHPLTAPLLTPIPPFSHPINYLFSSNHHCLTFQHLSHLPLTSMYHLVAVPTSPTVMWFGCFNLHPLRSLTYPPLYTLPLFIPIALTPCKCFNFHPLRSLAISKLLYSPIFVNHPLTMKKFSWFNLHPSKCHTHLSSGVYITAVHTWCTCGCDDCMCWLCSYYNYRNDFGLLLQPKHLRTLSCDPIALVHAFWTCVCDRESHIGA